MDSYLNITIRVSAANAVSAINSVRSAVNSLQDTTKASSAAGGFGASITNGFKGIPAAVSTALGSLSNFASNLKEVGYQFTAAFTAPIVLAGKSLVTYMLQNQTALADMKKVYGDINTPIAQVNSEVGALSKTFEVLSEQFGVNESDVTNIGALWAQAGVSGVALAQSVQTTLKAMVIGDLDATDATSSLIAIQAQYHASSSDLVNILNDLNVVENQTGASMGDLITGFSRAAGAAAASGVDYQHLAALIAALTPAAGSAANAGNALKTIFSRLLAPTSAAAAQLKIMGINVDSLNWTSETATQRLEDVASSFEKLTGQEQANASATISSRFQINRFDILMQDINNHLKNVTDGVTDQSGALSYYGIALSDTANQQTNAKIAAQELGIALKNPAVQLKQVGVTIKNTLTDALVQLIPTLLSFAGYIRQLATDFGNLSPTTQKYIFYVLALLAALGPVSFILGAVIKLFVVFSNTILGITKVAVGVGKAFFAIGSYILGLFATTTEANAAMVAETAATQAAMTEETVAGAQAAAAAVETGQVEQLAAQTEGEAAALVEQLAFWTVADLTATAGMAEIVATNEAGWALIETAPVTAIPVMSAALYALALVAAVAIAAVIIHFRDQIGTFLAGIGDDIWSAVKAVGNALAALPGIFVSVFNAVVRVVSQAVQQVYTLFSYLDPFAHHSPSLVENVTNGMAEVNAQFATLENVAGPVGVAYNVLQSFGNSIADIVAKTNQIAQQSDIANLLKFDPQLVPEYEALAAQYNNLTPLAISLNNAIVQQTAIVTADKNALDALTAQQTIYANEMTTAQTAINNYANTQITGQGAMSDAIFANTQAQKALQLQMDQMQDAVPGIDNVTDALASLQGQILQVQGTEKALRQSGAGSDILSTYDQQLGSLNNQQTSLQGTAAAYQNLSAQLAALQHQGDELNLEQSLDFDGLTRDIQQAASAMQELPFDQIMAGISSNQAALAAATTNYNAQTVAVNAAQASYDGANASLTNLTNSYNQVNDALTAVNDAMSKMNSLQSGQSGAASAAASAGGGAGAGGDFANAGLGSNLSAGNLPGDNTDAINAFTDQLSKQLQDATGKLDLTAPFKKIGNEITSTLSHIFVHIPEQWASDFGNAVGNFAVTASDDIVGWGASAAGAFASAGEAALNGLESFFSNLPKYMEDALYAAGYAIGYALGLWVKNFIELPGEIVNELKKLPGQLTAALKFLNQIGNVIVNLIYDGLVGSWHLIEDFFTQILPNILIYMGDALTWLHSVGNDILNGLWNGLVDGATTIWNWITSFVSGFIDGFKSALGIHSPSTIMYGIGQDIIQGLWNGIQAVWATVSAFFSGLATTIKNWLVGADAWLYNIGASVITGFWNGVHNIWNNSVSFLQSLDQIILNAIGDLSNDLLNVGKQVMTGLWNGMKDVWNDVKGWLKGLDPANWFNDINPYLGHAIVNLYGVGQQVFQGLHNGMMNQWDNVTNWLQGLNPAEYMNVPGFVGSLDPYGTNAPATQFTGSPVSSNGNSQITFTGDLSFPNITDPNDAEAFIKNLEVLARSGG